MTINRELMDKMDEVPRTALIVNQLTSAQSARWIVVVSLTVAIILLLGAGRDIPTELVGVYGLIVGSLFDTPSAIAHRENSVKLDE